MAKYKVHFFCNECGKVHPFPITIELDDGPAAKESIGDLYAGKELPENIATLVNNQIECPNTGVTTTQEDNNQVFLIPIE